MAQQIGDSRVPFTLQSMSKPFVYGLALEDRGKPALIQRIGVEPTGDSFNEISLERRTGRPFNPMINAGAIAATSLVVCILYLGIGWLVERKTQKWRHLR